MERYRADRVTAITHMRLHNSKLPINAIRSFCPGGHCRILLSRIKEEAEEETSSDIIIALTSGSYTVLRHQRARLTALIDNSLACFAATCEHLDGSEDKVCLPRSMGSYALAIASISLIRWALVAATAASLAVFNVVLLTETWQAVVVVGAVVDVDAVLMATRFFMSA